MPAPRELLVSPMNWKPACPEDLIGQAAKVAKAQVAKARRLAAELAICLHIGSMAFRGLDGDRKA